MWHSRNRNIQIHNGVWWRLEVQKYFVGQQFDEDDSVTVFFLLMWRTFCCHIELKLCSDTLLCDAVRRTIKPMYAWIWFERIILKAPLNDTQHIYSHPPFRLMKCHMLLLWMSTIQRFHVSCWCYCSMLCWMLGCMQINIQYPKSVQM